MTVGPRPSAAPAGEALERSGAPDPEAVDPTAFAGLDAEHGDFDTQLAALDARGASMWDGKALSAARLKTPESSGAQAAGGLALAQQQLDRAESLLANIQTPSSGALAAQLAAGDKTLTARVRQLAQQAFALAHRIDPSDQRDVEGAHRVQAAGPAGASTAMQAGRLAALRRQGSALERREHWNRALRLYRAALRQDPSLAFAQRGAARAAARAHLASGLERLIDHPDLLASPAVRQRAMTLLQSARIQNPSGPELQSQIAGLSRLLPQLDRPVPLNLASDDATRVTIPSIGVFGTFARREIRLMPGAYTIIGTRHGYRDVRREITVTPGDRNMTITVSCSQPI
jgi:tetratricopeptide (TPR) repeat protein